MCCLVEPGTESGIASVFYRMTIVQSGAVIAPWTLAGPYSFATISVNGTRIPDGSVVQVDIMPINGVGLYVGNWARSFIFCQRRCRDVLFSYLIDLIATLHRSSVFSRTGLKDSSAPVCANPIFVFGANVPSTYLLPRPTGALFRARVPAEAVHEQLG